VTATAGGLSDADIARFTALADTGVERLLANTSFGDDPLTAKNSDGHPWKLEYNKADLQLSVYSSATAIKLKRFLAVCTIPKYSPDELIEFIGDMKHRLTWDRNIKDLGTTTVSDADGKQILLLRCVTKQVLCDERYYS